MADQITYPNKSTGGTFAASEANEIKTVVNSHATDLEAIAISNEGVSLNVRADKKRFPTTKVTQSGALTFTSVSSGAINGYGEVKIVTCDGSNINLSGDFTNYSIIETTAGQTIVIVFVWNSSLSEYMVSVDPSAALSSSIILMQDNFTGTSIDTGKWTLTEGNANGTITQNDSLIFTTTSLVASRSNYLDSNTNMPATGAIQVTASNIDDNCSADIKLWDGTQQNEIDILGSAADRSIARIIIRQGDVGQYDLTTSISMNNTFKILRDGDDVSFYYLSAPDTWTQMGTTQTVSGLGTLYPTLQMQARTGPSSSNLDNFYQTNADYSTSTPT